MTETVKGRKLFDYMKTNNLSYCSNNTIFVSFNSFVEAYFRKTGNRNR